MKTQMAAALVLAVAAMVPGCVSTAESVRIAAAADLGCPASAIRTRDLGAGSFRAEGCGRRGFYVNDAARTVSSAATPARPGRWTIARR